MKTKNKILLTSFQTWLPHQTSNSSDDLLEILPKKYDYDFVDLFFLRQLPVDIDLASRKVVAEIEALQPDVIICCGMAEKRNKLTVESNGTNRHDCLYTSIDLTRLSRFALATEISHDAGKFVCEGLYYRVLNHLQNCSKNAHCIFVHVPLLQPSNHNIILHDLHLIICSLAFSLPKLTGSP